MSIGWFWFVLGLGITLMLAGAQQLAPEVSILWVFLFVLGSLLTAAALAIYLWPRQ